MQGRGWFIIYGVLLLMVIGLLIGELSLSGQLSAARRDIAELKKGTSPAPESPAPDPSASPAPTNGEPDLSTPAGRDAKRKADLAKIHDALTAFKSDTKAYPKALAELTPKYLPERPADPAPGKTYRYAKVGAGFRLTSVLESNDPEDVSPVDPKKDRIYVLTERSPSPAAQPPAAPEASDSGT